jgi:ribbon-helix-helix protein, copG family
MSKPRIVISLTDSQLKYVEQEAKAKGLTKSAVIALLIEGAKKFDGKEKKYA